MSDRDGGPISGPARSRGAGSTADEATWDQAASTAAVLMGAAVALVLVTGHVSARIFEGGWPQYELADAPGILWRFVGDPLDPAAAWEPVNRGTQLPGPVAWWAVYLVFILRVTAAVNLLRRAFTRIGNAMSPSNLTGWVPWRDPSRRVGPERWASWRERRRLHVRRSDRIRLVVGASTHHSALQRFARVTAGIGREKLLTIRSLNSLLVIGPAHAGKTSSVVVPAVLDWPGLAVVVSGKTALVDQTIGWRSRQGDVHVFDPSASTRYRGSGWSPFAECYVWTKATRTARDLTDSALASGMEVEHVHGLGHVVSRAMAPYLFAAALTKRGVTDLAYWVDSEERDEVLTILESAHPPAARAHHEATFRLDPRLRGAVFELMQTVFDPYLDPVVDESAERHEIIADELLDGTPQTLYVTTPYHDRARLRPLCTAVVRQIVGRIHEKAGSSGQPMSPPVLLVLDEGAGVAPTGDLQTLASSAASLGVQVVTVFEDVTQIVRRYGDKAHAVVNNHRATLYLPSRLDFESVAGAGGPPEVEARDQVSPEYHAAVLRRGLLPHSHVRDLAEGEAVLLYGNLAPIRVRLRPWFRSRTLRRKVETEQEVLPHRTVRGPNAMDPSAGTEPQAPPSPPPETIPALPGNVTRLGTRVRRRGDR